MTTTGLVLPPPGAGGAGEAVHRAECRWPPAAAGAHGRGYGGITDRRRVGHDSENTRSTCAFRGNPLRPSVVILMDVRDGECHGGIMSTIGGSAERAGWAGESAVLVAVFPTNHPGTPVTVSARVHRLGGAVVFGVLPVIVALVARHAGDAEHWAPSVPALRAWAVLSGACTALFLAVQVPVAFGSAPALPGIGLLQRLLFALAVALLVVLARAVHAAAGPVPVALAPVRGECGGAG